MRKVILILLLSFAVNVRAQDIHFSQFAVSKIGLNPATAGDTIRVILPDLTEETRKDFIKKAKAEAENAKVSVRNVRRDGIHNLHDLQKGGHVSEDIIKDNEGEIQKITDENIDKLNRLQNDKEKEILEV